MTRKHRFSDRFAAVAWLRNLRAQGTGGPPAPRAASPFVRLRAELLEDRLTPASFTNSAPTLTIELGANEAVGVISNATNYILTLTSVGSTWSGSSDLKVLAVGAVLSAKKVDFTQINITDTGSNASVAFNDSGTNTYDAGVSVLLTAPPLATSPLAGKRTCPAPMYWLPRRRTPLSPIAVRQSRLEPYLSALAAPASAPAAVPWRSAPPIWMQQRPATATRI